jgi:hypothetical protein
MVATSYELPVIRLDSSTETMFVAGITKPLLDELELPVAPPPDVLVVLAELLLEVAADAPPVAPVVVELEAEGELELPPPTATPGLPAAHVAPEATIERAVA